MQIEQTKAKIQELIVDFRANYSKYEQGSEANTETKLIEPLFEALGWVKQDFDKRIPARREGKRGIADYAFKVGDRTVFFLEAKTVGIPLEKEADKQVISYALSKRIPFAISTNFEELKVFCVEQENALTQTFRVFKKPEDYIINIQDLLLLSKESFENNLALKKAEDEGRLKKRMSIDKALLEDLIGIRKHIVEDLEKNYAQIYDLNEKEEIVQRIVDRLIFIRRCEDVGINPENFSLKEITELPHDEAYPKLKQYFKKYNEIYNSGLFVIGIDNDCDKINVNGLIIKKLIDCLYESKDKQYIYNFDWIDADVLGQIYEQYLGKILQQTKSGKAKLKNGQAHRRESGIYYTPTFIVDFIVKNTLGELLKDKKVKLKELKILDPACGSGSFLIKAFDYLYGNLSDSDDAKQHKLDGQGSYSIKTEILKKNLYGVDLDNKAVEITKLNLLLKAAEKNRRLPEEIDLHIRNGNSLIDNENIDKNAFVWKGDFQAETFDVIIGNPPYGASLNKEERSFFLENYKYRDKDINTFVLFIERAEKVLKNTGKFGYIVPKNIIKTDDYENIRKFIFENFSIESITDCGKSFEEVTGEMVILILRKQKKNSNKTKIFRIENEKLTEIGLIDQSEFGKLEKYRFNICLTEKILELLNNIKRDTLPLGGQVKIFRGVETGKKDAFISDKPKSKKFKPIIAGKDLDRYVIKNIRFIEYNPTLIEFKDERMYNQPKILVRKIAGEIHATFDKDNIYTTQGVYIFNNPDQNRLKFVLGLINSKLINWYYEIIFNMGSHLTTNVTIENLKNIPIAKTESVKIVHLVDKMLALNKRLSEIGEKNTAETKDIKGKIDGLDKEINQEVYQLYGLTKTEIKIIENS
ncbi:MAG TPA: N-6 DNA methylase [archaeon]|nr:N-6 DNA methylase [archaeon]